VSRVLVTDASRGLGHGFARHYLAQGDTILGSCRYSTAPGINSLRKEFCGRFIPVEFDVREAEAANAAAERAAGHVDALDLLINNAGTAPREPGTGVTDIDEEQVSLAFDVNVLGPARVLKAFYPLLSRGENPRVVMISSTAGSMGLTRGGRSIPYCVSKASLTIEDSVRSMTAVIEGLTVNSAPYQDYSGKEIPW